MDARYVSACEASQRLFCFKMHEQYPHTVRLPVHLDQLQNVYFSLRNTVEQIMAINENSLLLGYFKLNEKDQYARQLFYYQVPKHYTWNQKAKAWKPRAKYEITVLIYYVILLPN